jgi:thiol-disulfide isomerase/thioredoxin
VAATQETMVIDTRTFNSWWFGVLLSAIVLVYAQMTYALQPLHWATDKGNDYHRYQPPVKTSLLKQLVHGRSSSSSGVNGENDIGPESMVASGGTNRPTTSHAAFGGTLPLPSPTFEQRMRDIVFGKSRQNKSSRSESSGTASHQRRPSNVHVIETLQDYKTIVGDEPNQVVAVRFYATYCKACQVVAPLFYRLATLYPDVMFIDVPVTESNASLHQGLGVPSLPYSHIYHPMVGLVEEQKLTRNHIQSFKVKLQSYTSGVCPISYDDNDDERGDHAVVSE